MAPPIPPVSTRETYIKSYPTAFKRHLAFYDLDKDGVIWFGESLRASLSLGLNFPMALVMACGIQSWYGNVRPWILGPLRGVEIERVRDERFMLEGYRGSGLGTMGKERLLFEKTGTEEEAEKVDRVQLDGFVKKSDRGLFDRMHIMGIWALAADNQGKMSEMDIKLCQEGMLLPDLARRRENRDNVIPFLRGGPVSVAGHAWFVEKLFGVRVYQDPKERKGR